MGYVQEPGAPSLFEGHLGRQVTVEEGRGSHVGDHVAGQSVPAVAIV